MVPLEYIPKISAANNSTLSQSSFIYSMCTEKSIYVESLEYCKLVIVTLVYSQTLDWIYKMELKQVSDTLAFHRYVYLIAQNPRCGR